MPLSDIDDFAKLVEGIEKDLIKPRVGEFCPGDQTPILVPGKNEPLSPDVHLARWGFPSPVSSKLLINARSETILEKPTFRIPYQSKRCLVPSRGFFEWDKGKNKYLFSWPDHGWMWFGGIYWFFKNAAGSTFPAYTILTTTANGDLSDIHDRMPVIISQAHQHIWLYEKNIGTVGALLEPLPDGSLVRESCVR